MSRNPFALVFPLATVLLIFTLVLLFLTATGLEPGPLPVVAAPAAAEPGGCATQAGPCGPDSAFVASLSPADAEAIAAGDALFEANCAQCHAINDVVVGPALAGLDKRRPLPWIVRWVRNSSQVVASGDAYGVKLFNEYQKQQMPSFALSEAEVTSIVRYIRSQEGSCLPRTDVVVASR